MAEYVPNLIEQRKWLAHRRDLQPNDILSSWPLKVGFRKGMRKFKEQVGHFLLDDHDLIS